MSVDLIHLGVHKAASTYLQEEGFANHPQIRAVTWRNSPDVNALLWSLSKGYVSYRKDELRRYFETVRSETPPDQKIVLSYEGFAGNMFSGENNRYAAEQLREAFGPTKVLVVLRDPYRYILSAWCHYVIDGGVLSLANFLRSCAAPTGVKVWFDTEEPQGLFQKVIYAPYVEFLFEVFERENVHVLFFEDMRRDFAQFMRDVYAAVGVDESHIPASDVVLPSQQKVSPSQARYLRLLNHFCPTQFSVPFFACVPSSWRQKAIKRLNRYVADGSPDLRGLLDDRTKRQIQESNGRLSGLLGQDAAERGYDCG